MSEAVVASIGTTHPWNIAGLGLDQQVAAGYGVRVLTVVAGVTAQDAKGLHAAYALPGAIVRAQFEALPMDKVDVLRVGALIGKSNVELVASFLEKYPKTTAVVDPVFGATLGGAFLDEAAFVAFRDGIATLPSVVLTPNLEEAERLLERTGLGRDDLGEVAKELRARGVRAVLVKGGHLDGDPVDALATAHGVDLYRDERLSGAMRGGGCVLAMTLACELARGLPLVDAVQSARAYVRTRIVSRQRFGGLQVAY
ncbi:MAG: hydroxymethylpyrimidine/phosphomethylpyrimidine kinase [Candidatus Eremiobacteraeota bacterium]|nr:hydroxymethylpyrimidine/phosphomethylpyrimidine kinase [Candidatus Eremiobacteraeota bacterium]